MFFLSKHFKWNAIFIERFWMWRFLITWICSYYNMAHSNNSKMTVSNHQPLVIKRWMQVSRYINHSGQNNVVDSVHLCKNILDQIKRNCKNLWAMSVQKQLTSADPRWHLYRHYFQLHLLHISAGCQNLYQPC